MKAKWWTTDTIFVLCMGGMMAVLFGTSFFARSPQTEGSALVPAALLKKIIEQGQKCETRTDDDVTNHIPRRPC
jgi:hypothetical protein